jgi:hypothetical protein
MKDLTPVPCGCGCGESFVPFDARGRSRRFIAGHRSRLQPNKRTEVPCLNCGAIITRPAWHLRQTGERNFCDRTCRGEWMTKVGAVRGSNNGHYNTVTVGCATCDTPVSRAKSLVERRNGRIYCPTCIADARPPFPPAGTVNPPDWTLELRARIRHRDDYTCQVCGVRQTDVSFHVHHIDYDRTNNGDWKNLITLCPTCHMRTNWGMGIWTTRLQALMRDRFP